MEGKMKFERTATKLSLAGKGLKPTGQPRL